MSDVTRRAAAGAAGALAGLLVVAAHALSGGAAVSRPPVSVDVADLAPGAALPSAVGDALPGLDAGAPAPAPDALRTALGPLLTDPALGPSLSVDILDPASGAHLAERESGTARVPASTLKILTAAATLGALDPQDTLPTRAVAGAAGEVVLVGGGDVLLAAGRGDPAGVNGHAGLADLARSTAAALEKAGTAAVAVRVDDTLFSGPATAPTWSPGDLRSGFVAPVTALATDAGRLAAGRYAPRDGDPTLRAGRQFAAALAAAGVAVTGGVARGTAPADADVLGEVRSASIGDVVEYMLTESDNTVSEALGRLVAREAGQPAAFASVGPAVLARLRELGVPVDGARLADGSGLGDGSAVAATTLTAVLALAVSDDHPELRPVLSGLPVAGVSGTLVDRFGRRTQRPATGVVRAKTGSLSGVSSLAGVVVDADGRLLVFALLADRVAATEPSRQALDAVATTLAGCGCR